MTKHLHLEADIKPIGPTRSPPTPYVVVARTPMIKLPVHVQIKKVSRHYLDPTMRGKLELSPY
jgi:hypothetical protein